MHFKTLYDFTPCFPCFIFTNCNAYLLSSFDFLPTTKCDSFLFGIIVWIIQWLFVFRQHWTIIFPLRGSIAWITFALLTIVLPNCVRWAETLVSMTCWFPWKSDRYCHIPYTGMKIQGCFFSKLIACDFWKKLYNIEKESFFSNLSWKPKLPFWKPTVSFPFTMSSTFLSFHNKFRFWTFWDLPSNFLI